MVTCNYTLYFGEMVVASNGERRMLSLDMISARLLLFLIGLKCFVSCRVQSNLFHNPVLGNMVSKKKNRKQTNKKN